MTSPTTTASKLNRGVIEKLGDVDVFTFEAADSGTVDLTITPEWRDSFRDQSLRSANLKIKATLYASAVGGSGEATLGSVIVTDNQAADTYAQLSATIDAGTYYVVVEAVGSGEILGTGFSSYGSLGRYLIDGSVPAPPSSYTLGVTLAGTGAGTVTSSPSGISCGSTCSADFTSGFVVDLAATSSSGSTFAGWSGACSGAGTCSVTMSATKSVTATFTAVPNYALTISRSGTGSGTVSSSPSGINCGSTCSASFSSGTVVNLVASASSGSTFAGWSGACTGTGSCSVTMSAAKSVTATFTLRPSYTLSVARSGTGSGTVSSSLSGINCGSTCSASFSSGTVVNLVASASSGSTFAGWSGACTGTGSCSVTMSAAKSVAATFTLRPSYTLSVARSGTGSGTVSSSPSGINCGATCSASFTSGFVVNLVAKSASNSTFAGWSGACTGTGACSVTMSAVKTVSAAFKLRPIVTLSVAKGGLGRGIVKSTPKGISCGATCSATFFAKSGVSLTATASTGYVFGYWTGACTGTNPLCELTLGSSNKATRAVFNLATGKVLTINIGGGGRGTVTSAPEAVSCGSTCSARFPTNSTVTLTAKASSGSKFKAWSGACTGAAKTCKVKLSKARTVTASFAKSTAATVAER